MRAIVIKEFGGPEVLAIEDRPMPALQPGFVLIEVKAFGLNRAEIYMRKGAWGKTAEISGIECVGVVSRDPSGHWSKGEKVMALVGGMGRDVNGTYAEFVAVPAANVVAITSELGWDELAAIPESYATAWSALIGILAVGREHKLIIRGASSALGQAAVNIAAQVGAHIIATTRDDQRATMLRSLGAQEVVPETSFLSDLLRARHGQGLDAVLDIIGTSTVLDSLAMLRRGGRVCLVGFLGGGGQIGIDPIFQIPSGRHLSAFASALVIGTPEFPVSDIPFQAIIERVAKRTYKAKPARIFRFEEIQEAHRIMEANEVGGKIVVCL